VKVCREGEHKKIAEIVAANVEMSLIRNEFNYANMCPSFVEAHIT